LFAFFFLVELFQIYLQDFLSLSLSALIASKFDVDESLLPTDAQLVLLLEKEDFFSSVGITHERSIEPVVHRIDALSNLIEERDEAKPDEGDNDDDDEKKTVLLRGETIGKRSVTLAAAQMKRGFEEVKKKRILNLKIWFHFHLI